jgi:hypothetical protein
VSAGPSMDRPTTTAGVDAVRFQVHIPKNEVSNDLEEIKAMALMAAKSFRAG